MTLRDYFAGQALVGWLTALGGLEPPPDDEGLAKWAYETADAMIAERKED